MAQHTRAVQDKTCSAEGCERATNARGMCLMHFKRTRPRTPDKPRLVTCVVCGTQATRSPTSGKALVYGQTCSDACKRILRWGTRCDLPEDHWARTWGASSRIYVSSCARCQIPFTARRSTKLYCTEACAHPAVPLVLLGRGCGDCGQPFTTYHAERLWCSKRCASRVAKRARRAHEHKAIGAYTWMDVTRLWVLFDRACAYCRTPTPLDQIQAEHVIPISRRGANNITNLLPSCRFCNGDKRDLSLDAWAASRMARGLAPVATTWRAGDPRYRHLALPGRAEAAL